MRSVTFFVLPFIIYSVATATIQYTGTISVSSPSFYAPSWEGSSCIPSNTLWSYKWFTSDFSSPGVWEILASAELAIQKQIQIYIYTKFNPTQPCANSLLSRALTKQALTSSQGGPVVDDFVYFHHPSYVFVVAVPHGWNGTFGINILPPLVSGTTVGAPLWPIVTINSGVCQTYTTSPSTPFSYYTWAQPTSGRYDLVAMFDSPLDNWFSFIALYNSSVLWNQLQNPCNKTGAGRYLVSASGYFPGKGAALWYQTLKANTTYTLVFSGYGSTQVGFYGIRILPTQVRVPKQTPFVQPQRGIAQCYSDPYHDDSSWDTLAFNAQYSAYLIDTGDVMPPLTPFDTYSFLYRGENVGNPPIGCPYFAQLLAQADTGGAPLVQLTTIGTNYTVVLSTFSGYQTGTLQTYAYVLYVITGPYIPDNQTAPHSPSSPSSKTASPWLVLSFLTVVTLLAN